MGAVVHCGQGPEEQGRRSQTDGQLLGARGPIWAPRLSGPGSAGEYTPWRAAEGRWHSALCCSLAPAGALLRVYEGRGSPYTP